MKFQNLIFLIFCFILTVVLVACADDETKVHDQYGFPLVSWMLEYDIEEAHRFYEVGMDEALQLRSEEAFDGILFFGFPECLWCQVAVPVIHEASQLANVDIFYVSRTQSLRAGEWIDWDEDMAWWLDEQLDMRWIYEEGEDEEQGDPIRPNIFVPQIIHLRNGSIVDSHRGTFEEHVLVENGERNLPELTAEQRATLLEIYMRIFSGVNAPEVCPLEPNNVDGCS